MLSLREDTRKHAAMKVEATKLVLVSGKGAKWPPISEVKWYNSGQHVAVFSAEGN